MSRPWSNPGWIIQLHFADLFFSKQVVYKVRDHRTGSFSSLNVSYYFCVIVVQGRGRSITLLHQLLQKRSFFVFKKSHPMSRGPGRPPGSSSTRRNSDLIPIFLDDPHRGSIYAKPVSNSFSNVNVEAGTCGALR